MLIYCEMLMNTLMRVTVLFNPGRQFISRIPIKLRITTFPTTIKLVNDV